MCSLWLFSWFEDLKNFISLSKVFFIFLIFIFFSGCDSFEASTAVGLGQLPSTENPNREDPAPPPPSGPEKAINLAVGYGNADSTIISCDMGRTWVEGQSSPTAPPYNAQDPNAGIGHSDYFAGDFEYSGGLFYYVQGWFGPKRSKVSVSSDGINWSYLTPLGTQIVDSWSIAVTPASVIAGDHYWHYYSKDSGDLIWTRSEEIAPVVKQRHNYLSYYQGATESEDTIVSFDSDVPDVRLFAYSDDDGRSFKKAEGPSGVRCGGHRTAQIPGGGILLTVNHDMCYSLDGGRNWDLVTTLPEGQYTNLLWNGSKFMAYRGYKSRPAEEAVIFESTDGLNWIETPNQENLVLPGGFTTRSTSITYDPISQTYIGYNRGEYIRSDDGVVFESITVPQENRAVHPPLFMKTGMVNIPPGHPCY